MTATTVTTTGDVRSTSTNGKLGASVYPFSDDVDRHHGNDDGRHSQYFHQRKTRRQRRQSIQRPTRRRVAATYAGYNSTSYARFAADKLFAASELHADNNTWGSGPTPQAVQGFTDGYMLGFVCARMANMFAA
ncbi:MAG: hypothetical protein GY822_24695 [Deltaproteobacteria bacterium]|nr:hypothetical protein [Deltaproteobacteria bacterium]